jgi:hypothetical protein
MIIELDDGLYLNFTQSTKTWKYDSKNKATRFQSFADANAFMLDYQIRFMSPNARIVKGE